MKKNESEITKGYVISNKRMSSFLIDQTLKLPNNNKYFLAIYAIHRELTRITCYPLESKNIWKLHLKLNSLSESILVDIRKVLSYFHFHLVHTTGLNEKDGKYIVEYYGTFPNSILLDDLLKIDNNEENYTGFNNIDKENKSIKRIDNKKMVEIIQNSKILKDTQGAEITVDNLIKIQNEILELFPEIDNIYFLKIESK